MGFISKKLMLSPRGGGSVLKWNQALLPFSADWTVNLEYGNGKFVLLPNGVYGGPDIDKMTHSNDGITWTQGTLPIAFACHSLAYGGGKFVAVGTDGDYTYTGLYSINGINWQTMSLPTAEIWDAIAYGDGKFVALPFNTSRGAYSTDGINWTQTVNVVGNPHKIIYADGKFVAIGPNNGGYSTNGINWTAFNVPLSSNRLVSIAYGNGIFVAISNPLTVGGPCSSYVSSDCINWTQSAMPSAGWTTVTYGNGIFLAASYTIIPETNPAQNAIAAYSVDGINWIETLMPPYYPAQLTYINSRFFCTSYGTRISGSSGSFNTNVLLYTDSFA